MKLSKKQYKECFVELNALWNKFDPIGVYQPPSDWSDNEYESYVPHTLSLLAQGASAQKITDFFIETCNKTIGMKTSKNRCEQFTQLCQDWFASKYQELKLE